MKDKVFYSKDKFELPVNYMRLILENASEAIKIIQDECYKFVNQRCVEIYGYSPEEMCKKQLKDIVHPEDYEVIIANLHKRLNGDAVEKYPYRIIDKYGNIKWLELQAIRISWMRRPAVLGFTSDITLRIGAEDELKKSKKQLVDITNFMPDAMFAIDIEGKIIEWNMRMEKLSGINATDMIGKGDFEYALPFYGKRRPMLINLVSRPNTSLQNGYTYFKKMTNSLYAEGLFEKRGTSLYLRAEASLMFDHKNRVIGAVELIQDITELRHAQSDLNEKSIHLAETNTALRVLLKNIEDEKIEVEERFVSNIKELVVPYLERLKLSRLSDIQENYLTIAENHLSTVLSPFLTRMAQKHLKLTPREKEIAVLIKDGKTTKEISEILHIEGNTINNHRRHMRKKMGLESKKENLRSYLQSW